MIFESSDEVLGHADRSPSYTIVRDLTLRKPAPKQYRNTKEKTPRPGATKNYTREQVAAALRAHGGIMSRAAEGLGCSAALVLKYVKRDPELAAVMTEARERNIDIAESVLLRIMQDDDHPEQFSAVKYYLAHQGRGRGYAPTTLNVNIMTQPAVVDFFQRGLAAFVAAAWGQEGVDLLAAWLGAVQEGDPMAREDPGAWFLKHQGRLLEASP